MKERPLWQALKKYEQENIKGFHMPGHGQGRAFAKWPLDSALDMTEVPGLDDLHSPEGAILDAEVRAAGAFGAEKTFFLVQGATVGLQALCLANLREGDEVIVPRHCHRSIYGGLVLSGARPSYLSSILEKETGLPIATDLTALQSLPISQYGDIKALLALRPTYWGTAEDLHSWRECSQALQKPLWVDEAHGSAYAFSSLLPTSALKLGAQAVVHGSHKSLPALTQAAMLHLGQALQGQEEEHSRQGIMLRNALTILQTTSPSYLLMTSLDLARASMEEEGELLWQKTVERASFLRRELNQIKGIYCWSEEIKAYSTVSEWDQTRLLVVLRNPYVTGYQLRQLLREKGAIEAELAGPNYLLFLLSPFDHPEADGHLIETFKQVDFSLEGTGKEDGQVLAELFQQGHREAIEVRCTPREAFYGPRRIVPFKEALHKIAGQFICPYPPGIPLIAPGEVITPALLEVVHALERAGAKWQGAIDGKMEKIAILDL
ncbi:aminotransferase class I/II-fold pyridoxal phosphate-dependent enzyme [Heliorestis acidaminivorans]|uniref:aminotransferase class I/II-fold pyridoxal phosphate-dependent enzyme n=1 Tax=Heliorestis acidaminivorans TaxID=553427 RepID=UPI0014783CA8|nr:hypothetical protein [Heliorestis acidaminivorans]